MTRLDDLLSYDDAPRRPRRRWPAPVRVALWLAVPLFIEWQLDAFVRRAYGVDVPFLFVASATLCVLALRYILRALAAQPLPPSLRDAPPAPRTLSSAEDGVAEAVAHWNTRLEWAADDVSRFDQIVKPAIVDLIDERLRLQHGVSRAADPARARAVLPDALWSFIHTPTTRKMSAKQVAALVAQMETL
jgi:hypothetical protein